MARRIPKIKMKGVSRHFNKRTPCQFDHTHASKGEAEHCNNLHFLMHSTKGQIEKIEKEKRYKFTVNGKTICEHWPDWTVTYKDGTQEVIEYKGKAEPVWKLKKKMFEAFYPNIPYTVVYQGKGR